MGVSQVHRTTLIENLTIGVIVVMIIVMTAIAVAGWRRPPPR